MFFNEPRVTLRRRLALFFSVCSLLLVSAAFLAMPLTVSAHDGGGNRDGNGQQADRNDDHGHDAIDRDNDRNNANDNDVHDDRGHDAVDRDNNQSAMVPVMAGSVVVTGLIAQNTDR